MSRFYDYLDLAAHCAANARQASDPQYRSFFADMAAGWCERARELAEGIPRGLERITEIADEIADLAASQTQSYELATRVFH